MSREIVIPMIAGLVLMILLGWLIYLGLQLRQITRALRAHSAQQLIGGSRELWEIIFSDGTLAEFVFRAQDHPELLAQNEHLRWHCLMLTAYRQWDNHYYQFRLGSISEEMWSSYDSTMSSWLLHRGWREWFEKNSRYFSDSLQDHIREKINQLKAKPAYRLD